MHRFNLSAAAILVAAAISSNIAFSANAADSASDSGVKGVSSGAALTPLPIASPRPAARGPIRRQLIRLEREIADLHAALAKTWRLLEGRDLPAVTTALQSMQQRLQSMTAERIALWREATAARAPDLREPHSARWKSDRTETINPERTK